MDFKDEIKLLSERVLKLKDSIHTEEATKNAFIMPFINSLGYDVFNPLEVVPEYISDIGLKKGEKIDYAILKDGIPSILIECKHWGQNLNLHDGQLLRYFHVSKAKFGILTNGIIYRFYTDLIEPNKMDETPFLEVNLMDEVKEAHVEELKKFHKSYFDVEKIASAASELKYLNDIRTILAKEIENPSEDFIKFFASKTYNGRLTDKMIAYFGPIVKRTFTQYINDTIAERLKNALKKEQEQQPEPEPLIELLVDHSKKVETTDEEIEAYHIVKSILRQKIDVSRIKYRDSLAFFSILIDDNNRKPICKLYLKENKKIIGTFDSTGEVKREIAAINDIYTFADILLLTAEAYKN